MQNKLTEAQRANTEAASQSGMFKRNLEQVAVLEGCATECPVYYLDGVAYANTGPLFRELTPIGDHLQDSDGRKWTVRALESINATR